MRQQQADLFREGEYLPLAVEGAKANHVVAFVRKSESASVLVVVPRLVAGLLQDMDVAPIGPQIWGDTRVLLPSLLKSIGTRLPENPRVCRNPVAARIFLFPGLEGFSGSGVFTGLGSFTRCLIAAFFSRPDSLHRRTVTSGGATLVRAVMSLL